MIQLHGTNSKAKETLNELHRASKDPVNPEQLLEAAQRFVDTARAEIGELLEGGDEGPANDNSDRGYCAAYIRGLKEERVRFYRVLMKITETTVGSQVKLPSFEELIDPDAECRVTVRA